MNSLSLKLLCILFKRGTLSLHDLGIILETNSIELSDAMSDLLKQGAVEIVPSYASLHGNTLTLKAPLQITYLGKTLLEQEYRSNKHSKLHEFRAWATLAISALTLLVAAITLFLQITG